MLSEVTTLLLTYNEAPNIGRALEKLGRARQILVVDSFSSDGTLELLKAYPKVRVVQRPLDNLAADWNFGLSECQTEWVLALHADYVLTDALLSELYCWHPAAGVAAYFAHFKYCIAGHPMPESCYPPGPVLFRRQQCCYEQDGQKVRLKITGTIGWLRGEILHDDRKSLSCWIEAQSRYSKLEAEKLLGTPADQLGFKDRIRKKIMFAPALVFVYTLLGKRLLFDGWRGWYYVLLRTLAEVLLSLRLLEKKIEGGAEKLKR